MRAFDMLKLTEVIETTNELTQTLCKHIGHSRILLGSGIEMKGSNLVGERGNGVNEAQ